MIKEKEKEKSRLMKIKMLKSFARLISFKH